MGDGYSRSPKLLKGAIVQFKKMPIIPIPNIIIFQYNPESLTRSITPYAPSQGRTDRTAPQGTTETSSLAQPQEPSETFNVTLFLDATDALEDPISHPVAFISGVADRMAALEMLLYPQGDSLLGALAAPIVASLGFGGASANADTYAKRPEVPVTLFIWGPGRIVPVRLQTFSVEEQQWNQLLYPTRARVTVGMKVLTKDELDADTTDETDGKAIASFCYKWTRTQKEALALLNIANTAESILGILPF